MEMETELEFDIDEPKEPVVSLLGAGTADLWLWMEGRCGDENAGDKRDPFWMCNDAISEPLLFVAAE